MDNTTEPAERQVEEISSLCMNCHEDGTTRMLLTRIPFFREIIIMSFSCLKCNFQNSEIQSAGEIQQRGVHFTFKLDSAADLQRQIVKSDTAVFRIEELDLEIPPGRGQLTNIEGLLSMIRQDLGTKQEERRQLDEGLYQKIQTILDTLDAMTSGTRLPFSISLNDSAGNSSVEPSPTDGTGKYSRHEYPRTPEQNAALGLAPNAESSTDDDTQAPPPVLRPEYHANNMTPALPSADPNTLLNNDEIVENEVYSFPSSCPGCTKPCATNMKMVRIPHFEEVVIMSTACQACGYRSNEVKSGGKVPEKGRRIKLQVQRREDLSRDILKAEHCSLACPELSLTVEPGTLGGRFTTVEGLLTQVRDDLRSSIFDMGHASVGGGQVTSIDGVGGDSMPAQDKLKWTKFFAQLDQGINGEVPFTLVLEDPMGASYVQSFVAPEPDPHIEVEEYERTEAEEEHLGLRDMKTEGYEVKEEDAKADGLGKENLPAAEGIDVDEIQNAVKSRLAALESEEKGEAEEAS